jgi:hypothetical protein
VFGLYEIFMLFPSFFAATLFAMCLYLHMQRRRVMDILFIGITIVLFVASWLLVKLVERV